MIKLKQKREKTKNSKRINARWSLCVGNIRTGNHPRKQLRIKIRIEDFCIRPTLVQACWLFFFFFLYLVNL